MNRVIAHNVDAITATKIAILLNKCEQDLGMTVDEVLEAIGDIASRFTRNQFRAMLHDAAGNTLTVNSAAEYQEKLNEGQWFANPREAIEALDLTKAELEQTKKDAQRDALKDHSEGAEVGFDQKVTLPGGQVGGVVVNDSKKKQ